MVEDHSAMTRDLAADLAQSDGLTTRKQLLALGHSTQAIRRALAGQDVYVPRRGWIATRDAPSLALRAIDIGGRVGGASALDTYGIWVDDAIPTIVVDPHASRVPHPRGEVTHQWVRQHFPEASTRPWRVSVRDALLQLAATADRPSLIASIDSALYTRRLRPAQFVDLLDALPERLHRVQREIDARAMSGTETKLRLACRAAGLRVDIQVTIPGIGTVDIVVDEWLIIEVDSKKHHGEPVQQHKDRVRDGTAVLGKFGFLRFDYPLVQYELAWCMDVIFARLAEGRP
jgi:very-short-patch-repair endonuclease